MTVHRPSTAPQTHGTAAYPNYRTKESASARTEPRRRIEAFFLVVAMTFFGRVWIWPIDVESQIELYKPFGYALRFAFILIIPYAVYLARYIIRPTLIYPTSIFVTLVAFCWLSLLWTTQITTTFQNCLDILCLTLTALVVSQRMSLIQIQRVIFFASLVIIGISAALSALHVDFAIMGGVHSGRWRGLFGHKNNYAEFVLFSSIIVMFMPKDVGIGKIYRAVFFVLSIVSLAFSQSSTNVSLFAFASIIKILWPTIRSISKNRFLLLASMVVFGYIVSTALISATSEILDSLGRDITFTGRTLIWSHYFDVSLRAPYFGSGYGAFFTDAEVTEEARRKLFAIIRTPHNGYIAVALGVGWIGVLMYAVWHVSLLWLGVTNQLGRISGTIFALAACYAVFSMFEVSGAAMIALGLQLLLVLSCAALRELRNGRSVTAPASSSIRMR